MTPRPRRIAAISASLVLATSVAACGGGDSAEKSASGQGGKLLVWTLDNQPDRIAKQKKVVEAYTAKTGTQVELVGIDEAQFPQLIAGAAQSGNLPDVVGSLSLGYVRQIDGQGLLDHEAAKGVVDKLGPDTFSAGSLQMTRNGEEQLAVPSDSWSQILVYRKDLFQKAGLKPPTTYADLQKAAQTLTKDGKFGITLATDPGDPFTSQTFEALALGNGCNLVDGQGKVTLDSSQCASTWNLYGELASKYSPKGKQDVDTTRAAYFSGDAAMTMWSTFLLDEMAGLRKDALPTCPECRSDPGYLAKNSGIVTTIKGPDGQKAGSFSEIASWGLTTGDKTKEAQNFVQYMLSDGYVDWLSMAPEGKYPVRSGASAGSREYADKWGSLPAGVDKREPLSKYYSADTITVLQKSGQNVDRWGYEEGQGALAGAVVSELPVSKAVASLGSGTSAPDAMKSAAGAVREIQSGLR